MIGNAHIDPVWLWRWQAGVDEALATFRSAADRCEEYPEFILTEGIHVQKASQASASPAGSESGRATRAKIAYSALRYATAMMQVAAQESQPRGLAGRRQAMIAPMIEKLTARTAFSSQ
jgi:hypothetical protein